MTRSKRTIVNGLIGMMRQLVTVICGLILPKYMLVYFGSEVNGLVSSITQFLGFITLLEMGIGPVIQASLYKPLATKDKDKISKIVLSSERFFKKIGYIFIAYIGILVIIFPNIIDGDFDFIYTSSLILIISISTLAQYFFGASYQILLNANQSAFVQNTLQIITVLLNTFFSVILISLGAEIHVVKFVTSIIYIMRPIGQILYVKKHFDINRSVKLSSHEEPIKQKWNGFAQHLAGWVCTGTDTLVLTAFSTLGNISIYSVYYMVIISLTNLIFMAATGLDSAYGDMLARKEYAELEKSFSRAEFLTHFLVTYIFTITMVVIVPFVKVYTKEISDANYIVPSFAILLVCAYAIQSIRIPYSKVIYASGKFKETQNGALISALINIVVTTSLVFKFGLIGTAFGTLAAMFYHTLYYVWFLNKNIMKRPKRIFFRLLLSDIITMMITYGISSIFILKTITYIAWVILSLKVAFLTLIVIFIVYFIFNYKYIIRILSVSKM